LQTDAVPGSKQAVAMIMPAPWAARLPT